MSPKKRFLLRFKIVLSGTGVLQFSKFFIFAAMAYILPPAQYGYFHLFIIAQNYLSNSNLGVLNALNRNVPLYLGQGKREQADEVKRQALMFTTASSFVFAISVLIYAAFVSGQLRAILIANACILFLQQFYFYNEFVLKAEQRFKELSQFQGAFGITSIILCISLGLTWKLNGTYIAYFLAYIVIFGYALYISRINIISLLSEKFNQTVIKDLMTIGFPIMVLGFTYHLMLTLDRFIILHFYSIKDVGYYSLMNIINGFFQLIAMSASTVLYPEIMNHLGEKKTYMFIFRRLTKFMLFGAAGFGATALLLVIITPSVVQRFYPEYIEFLGIYKLLITGIVFLNLNFFNSIFIVAIKRQVLFIGIQLGIVCAAVLLNVFLCVKANYGLNGIAFIFMGASMLNFFLSYGTSAVIAKRNYDSFQLT